MRGPVNPFAAFILTVAVGAAPCAADAAQAADQDGKAAAGRSADAGQGVPATHGAEKPSSLPPEVEAILSAPAAGDYPGEEQCLSRHRIREVKVLDERHVVFKMDRKQLYLVQFQHRCPGLRRNDPVIYESLNSMSVCRHDTMRALTPFGFGDSRAGPPCFIPGFQQISEEQLGMLREALKQRR